MQIRQGEISVHYLLIVLASIGILVAPAIVAAKSDYDLPDDKK
jgi:hypothetical protein